ncbi:RNA polymerase sigma factor [Kitasatospora sp. NPDC056327]|uniref:RNA polymerase sigma factor n=1 Tax=Kitasatospora sp. NPDC056327 TaxID=3345785 RepID=UPI0035D8FA75
MTEDQATGAHLPHQDLELYAHLRAADFVGVRFELFREQLWAYGLRVLAAWMYEGTIGARAGIRLWEKELPMLRRSQDLREELALETLMKVDQWWFAPDAPYGLRTWDPYGGASLNTFFVGACLTEFRNAVRKWRTTRERATQTALDLMKTAREDRAPGPQQAIELRDALRRILREASRDQQAICWYVYSGDLTYKEIGAELGGLTGRAVEGQMRRLRLSAKRMVDAGVVDVPARFLPTVRSGSAGTRGGA